MASDLTIEFAQSNQQIGDNGSMLLQMTVKLGVEPAVRD